MNLVSTKIVLTHDLQNAPYEFSLKRRVLTAQVKKYLLRNFVQSGSFYYPRAWVITIYFLFVAKLSLLGIEYYTVSALICTQ